MAKVVSISERVHQPFWETVRIYYAAAGWFPCVPVRARTRARLRVLPAVPGGRPAVLVIEVRG